MKKKEILKILVASSALAGGIGLTGNTVQAVENNNKTNPDNSNGSTTKVSIQTSGKVINVSSNLRVRCDAGDNYDTIGYVCNGQDVEILSEKGDWYRISFDGREGYVSKKYISVENNNQQVKSEDTARNVVNPVETNKQGKVINVNSVLNIRQAADSNSAVLGTLKNGDTFEIISKTGDWCNIKSHNIVGFIGSKYVQEVTGNETTVEDVIETITGTYQEEKAQSSVPVEQGVVVNISTNLTVRNGASLSSNPIGYLLNGQAVSIKGESSGWYNIDFNGQNGYVSKQYVQKGSAQASQPAPASVSVAAIGTGTVVNISSSLNIRSGAGTGHSVVGSLTNGATVSIIGKDGSWYHINHNGVTGYVSSEYIREGSAGAGNAGSGSSNESAASGTGTVVNISSSLNIRSGAGTGHSVVGHLTNGATVSIIGKNGSWYHISHNGVTGYVSSEYIREGSSSGSTSNGTTAPSSGKGQVYNITSNLRVRSGASTGSSILGYILNGQIVDIIGTSGDWVHINYNGTTGYVSSQYIRSVDANTNAGTSTATYSRVYEIMRQQIGSPYVWGGAGEALTTSNLNALKARFPDKAAAGRYSNAEKRVNQGLRAFDCSGLMQWCFAQAGVNLGRTTYQQINNGYEVSLSNLQPGDLLFVSDLSHVGMYVGNGQWIESPNSNAVIRMVDVPWSRVTRARRVL